MEKGTLLAIVCHCSDINESVDEWEGR